MGRLGSGGSVMREEVEHVEKYPEFYGDALSTDSPNWETGGHVHNWRKHMSGRMRLLWPTLSKDVRAALIMDADDAASAEEWE